MAPHLTRSAAAMLLAGVITASTFAEQSLTSDGPRPGIASAVRTCSKTLSPLDVTAPQWNGWGASLSNDRFQRKQAGLTRKEAGSLKLRWAYGFDGDTSAVLQPSVIGRRIFIGSSLGIVYSLDLQEGCTYWTYRADGPVRASITIAQTGTTRHDASAFFSDAIGNAYRLDASTGRLVWKRHVDDNTAVRTVGSPQFYAGRLYVPLSSIEEVLGASQSYECCKFRGGVVALDASSGAPVWRAYSVRVDPQPTGKNTAGTQLYGPSGAGTWSAPTIDVKQKRLYFTTGNNYSDPPTSTSDAILAVDLATGELLWATQFTQGDAFNVACTQPDSTNCPQQHGQDTDFSSPAILVSRPYGKRLLIAGQKSGLVHAIDPDQNGRKIWSTRVANGGLLGGVMWGSAADSDRIYVAVSDYVLNGKLNPDAGGLVALRIADGKELWRTPAPVAHCGERKVCSPAQPAAVSLIPGVVFSGSRDGNLRAYDTDSGRILWTFDTARDFETVNGVKAHGGSIDVGGPAVVDGVVLTTSGYAQFGGSDGNVLLAFSVGGR